MGWVIFLGESQSRIYLNMCAKFGCGPRVVSKKKGRYRQTDRQRETAALYSRLVPVSMILFWWLSYRYSLGCGLGYGYLWCGIRVRVSLWLGLGLG